MLEFTNAIQAIVFGGTLPDGSSLTGLQREITSEDTDLGYGQDLTCIDDFTFDFVENDPFSSLAVAQDIYHRLTTERGLIPDDEDYGLDIIRMLQRGFSPNGLIETKGQIENEIRKDDRIDPRTLKVAVSIDSTSDAPTLSISISATSSQGPFSLIMSASDMGVVLQSISNT